MRDGFLYTGIIGGEIIRLNLKNPTGPWEKVFKYKDVECRQRHKDPKCGRPLGIEFDSKGRLVVADAYFAVYRISADFKTAEQIVDPEEEVNGKLPVFVNCVTVGKDDTIYYSIADTYFKIHESLFGLLHAPKERLMRVDPKTKKSEVLLDNLMMANGVQISPKGDYVLVSELGAGRILKYHLEGSKKDEVELFLQVPGLPDNITPNDQGGYFIGVAPVPEGEFHPFIDFFYKQPLFNKVLTRFFFGIKFIVEQINQHIYSHEILDKFDYHFTNAESLGEPPADSRLMMRGFVIEIDSDGRVIRTHQSTNPDVAYISEGLLHEGYLYLGSYMNDHVARVPYRD